MSQGPGGWYQRSNICVIIVPIECGSENKNEDIMAVWEKAYIYINLEI